MAATARFPAARPTAPRAAVAATVAGRPAVAVVVGMVAVGQAAAAPAGQAAAPAGQAVAAPAGQAVAVQQAVAVAAGMAAEVVKAAVFSRPRAIDRPPRPQPPRQHRHSL